MYMYTLQHLLYVARGDQAQRYIVQIYMNTLNDRIDHALQMMVLFCSLKEMDKSPATHNTYVFHTFSYTHTLSHSHT